MKKGSSTTRPAEIVRHGDGWQVRYNIEQVEREVDGETVIEWRYDYLQIPAASVRGDLQRFCRKAVRAARLGCLTVTTATGKTFDADETSQTRMARALQTAAITGQTETAWTLADNAVETVTLEEMREALALAMQAQAEVWFI